MVESHHRRLSFGPFAPHRPVTIYRLVCKQTIEEKILKLHQHKRDLADSLLKGADRSGKMSADDLLP